MKVKQEGAPQGETLQPATTRKKRPTDSETNQLAVKEEQALASQPGQTEDSLFDEFERQIPVWKAEYGKIFKSVIDGDIYIWRKLKRKEYTDIMSSYKDQPQVTDRIYERQEKITETIVLYPYNIVELVKNSAGLATTISDEALLKSGFDLATTEEL